MRKTLNSSLMAVVAIFTFIVMLPACSPSGGGGGSNPVAPPPVQQVTGLEVMSINPASGAELTANKQKASVRMTAYFGPELKNLDVMVEITPVDANGEVMTGPPGAHTYFKERLSQKAILTLKTGSTYPGTSHGFQVVFRDPDDPLKTPYATFLIGANFEIPKEAKYVWVA